MPAKNASAILWASSERRASSRSSSWSKATTTGIFRVRENFHQHLEQGQHQVLPGWADLEVKLGKPVVRKFASVGFVAAQGRPGRSPDKCARRIRPAVLCVSVFSTWAAINSHAFSADRPASWIARRTLIGARLTAARAVSVSTSQAARSACAAAAAEAESSGPLADALDRE